MRPTTFLPVSSLVLLGLIAGGPGLLASSRDLGTGARTDLVVTVLGTQGAEKRILAPSDLTVTIAGSPAEVLGVQPVTSEPLQLTVLLDDSAGPSSTSLQFGELRAFLESLPATAQVAVGYMRNGTVFYTQAFTLDHQAAAKSLRVPLGVPGVNGSPYFALGDLAKHWPSEQSSARRAVLMLTDGVDPYYGSAILDDPYVDSAVRDAVEHDVAVYSIYLRGAGMRGDGLGHSWVTDLAQSRLDEVAERTGGHAYFQGFTSPVTIAPFLDNLEDRFVSQYQVTIATGAGKGLQSVELHSTVPELKIEGPGRIYVK